MERSPVSHITRQYCHRCRRDTEQEALFWPAERWQVGFSKVALFETQCMHCRARVAGWPNRVMLDFVQAVA